jgi:ribonucleoside-diphosphate reductase alpha chain
MNEKQWLGKENKIGIDIFNNKYRQLDENFDQWLDRISNGDSELKQLIIDKKFLFGGRILSNRGLQNRGLKVTYSNCYVLAKPQDNLESIFDTAKKLARTFSYGGGCGIDISELAPMGAKVNNTAKETSGAVSFMDLYSLVTGLIGQNGRRGALMISLICNHPDLLEFIDIKSDLNKVTKANISIRILNEFMEAVKNDEDYTLSFSRKETNDKIIKVVKARAVFRRIAEMNWDYAEPGMLFWDRIENWNLLANTKNFEFAGTNPCAEEPLPPGGSCLLGSINLSAFVNKDKQFNLAEFEHAVRIAVKALNDVLDEGLPLHPLQEQRDSVRDWRQIGLGIFGLADMLIKMGIEYGSQEAMNVCHTIGGYMIDSAICTSAYLARDFGTYPEYNYDEVASTIFFKTNTSEHTKNIVKLYGLRNSQLLTIAPTGTLSTMLGVSGGIEPIFANYYERKTESLHNKEVTYKVYTPIVQEYMNQNNISYEELPSYFVTAQTLNYKDRIDMQALWQMYIDASISSTVNVPNDFTIEQVEDLYLYAYEKGLKGVTIFRDGCKRLGVLTTDSSKKEEKTETITESNKELRRGVIIQVNDDVIGKKRKLVTGCGSLHCQAYFDPITGDLLESYFSKGSTGGCNNFMIGLSRMISLAARAGVDIYTIADQLDSSGVCASYAVRRATKGDTSKGACCPIAIGKALIEMYEELQEELGFTDDFLDDEDEEDEDEIIEIPTKVNKPTGIIRKNPCPKCGEELIAEGGCNICKSCGWSKCD